MANDWFAPIEKAYPELEAEYKRLELDKSLDIASRNAQYAELILSWGGYRESVSSRLFLYSLCSLKIYRSQP